MSILRNSSYNLLGAVSVGLMSWALGIIIGRNFGPEGLGHYGLATAIVFPIFTLGFLGMRPVYVSGKKGAPRHSTAYIARTTGLLVALVCTICVTLSVETWRHSLLLVLILSMNKFIDGQADILYAWHQKRRDFKIIALSMIGKSTLTLIVLLCFGSWAENQETILIIQFVVFAIFLFFYDWPKSNLSFRNLRQETFKDVWSLLLFVMPLAFSTVCIAVNASLPRLFGAQNAYALGVFSGLFLIIQAGNMLAVALGQALNPLIGSFFHAKNWPGIRKLCYIAIGAWGAFSVLIIVLSYTFGLYGFTMIYGNQFTLDQSNFTLIVIGGIFSYGTTLAGYFLTGLQQIRIQIPLFGIILFVTALAGFIYFYSLPQVLIKDIGLLYTLSNGLGLILIVMVLFWKVYTLSYWSERNPS